MIKRILIFCGSRMFYEAEQTLLKNKDTNIAFIEAPTGAGKSNLAMNCSLKLLDKNINKIFSHVYPFNTLVEQVLRIRLKNIRADRYF